MGQGFKVTCKCQSKGISTGVGLLYPKQFSEAVHDIKNGKYGEEMKQVMDENKNVTVDASYGLYQCRACGDVECMKKMNLYQVESGASDGEKTSENGDLKQESDESKMPKMQMSFDGCKMVKEFEHQCPQCQKNMCEMSEEEIAQTTCPKCKEKYRVSDRILWD